MSLFDSASLVVTPNGTKASKLYAIKPTDGSGDLTVVRATSATRVNSSGLIESVASNVPRLDYTNSTCPSILVEPQRTNLVLRSEEFDNATWIGVNGGIGSLPTRTPNVAIAPDGTLTADLVVFNINDGTSSADISQIQQNLSLTSSIHTFSIYAKSSDNITRIVKVVMPSGNVFNITITADWQRFTVTDTAVGTGAIRLRLRGNESTAKIANLHLWGAQLEVGANATSYVPTVASSVTRNSDVISKTGISDLIGQTEGTIYMEVNVNSINNSTGRLLYTIYNNSTNARISSGIGTNNKIDLFVTGTPNTQIFSQTISIGKLKLAVSYKNSNIFLTVNGVLATAITTLNVPSSMNSLILGAVFNGTLQLGDGIDLFAHWKTALTEQECINLTTL